MAITVHGQLTASLDLLDVYQAAGSFKALMLTSLYTYAAAHQYVSDLTPASNEVAGGSYARQTLTAATPTSGGGTTKIPITGNTTFTAVPGSFRYIVTYREVTTDANSPIIGVIDYGDDILVDGNDYTVTLGNLMEEAVA